MLLLGALHPETPPAPAYPRALKLDLFGVLWSHRSTVPNRPPNRFSVTVVCAVNCAQRNLMYRAYTAEFVLLETALPSSEFTSKAAVIRNYQNQYLLVNV